MTVRCDRGRSLYGCFLGLDTHCVFVDQLSAQNTGDADKQGGEQGQVKPPGQNVYCAGFGCAYGKTQQPVQGGQGQQHHRQYGVTPGGNQAAYSRHCNQIHQTGETGNPASKSANACQPQTGAGPESIATEHKGQVRSNEADQRRNRKMNEYRVQGVAANRHFAAYGLRNHEWPPGMTPGQCCRDYPAYRHEHGPCRVTQRFELLRQRKRRFVSCQRVSAIAIAALSLLTGCTGPFSMLDPGGQAAAEAAWLWWGMFIGATLVLSGVVGLWLVACRRSASAERPGESRRQGQYFLVGGGLVLPFLAIGALLVFGVPAGQRMMPGPGTPGEVLRIEVTGHQWWWEVFYPDSGIRLRDEIHIPVQAPVDIHLTSADVVHSFWVPRLAGKLDALPGRHHVLRLRADEAGIYRGLCAEFCGLRHAHMQFLVKAHLPDAFEAWLASAVTANGEDEGVTEADTQGGLTR